MNTNNLLLLQRDSGVVQQELRDELSFHVKKGENISLIALVLTGKVDLKVYLDEEDSSCDIKVLYLVNQNETVDINVTCSHIKGNSQSSQIIKGIATDEGKVNFHGKIYIAPDAQKSDGYQNHRALVLSNKAEIQSIPELEIYADDVKCAHGSATGPLEKEALFYLMSRGIPEKKSKRLLLHSFVNDMIPLEYQTITDDWINQNV